MRILAAIAALVTVAALSLPACGGDDESSGATTQAAGNEQLCSAIDDLQSSVASLKDLDPSTASLSDVTSSVQAVVTDGKAVASAAGSTAEGDVSKLHELPGRPRVAAQGDPLERKRSGRRAAARVRR